MSSRLKFSDGTEEVVRDPAYCDGCKKLGHNNLCERFSTIICWLNRRCFSCREEAEVIPVIASSNSTNP